MQGLDRILAAIDPRLCVACKGSRGLCGVDPCPLLQRIRSTMPQVAREGRPLGRDLFGSSPPSLFVGRHGYPKVSIGPMLPPEHREEEAARLLDSPRAWLDRSIPDIVGLRSSLLRTTHPVAVDMAARFPDRITRISQELAMAAGPVDTEVHLAKAPRFGIPAVGEFTAPHGPTIEVQRAELAENVRVERPVERVTADTDLRASEAIVDLYRSGTDPYHLERILSAGMLGLGTKRRLVPTRWSITATDDQLGLHLTGQVLRLPTIDKPRVHFAQRFGNRFHVLLLPRVWGFDNVEAWGKGSFWAQAGGGPMGSRPETGGAGDGRPGGAPAGEATGGTAAEGTAAGGEATGGGAAWGGSVMGGAAGLAGSSGAAMSPPAPSTAVIAAEDWEDHTGRSRYASNTAGGYYATRVSVLEHLVRIGRQATAIVLREVTDDYTTPLGVWVVRETARLAMEAKPLHFEDIDAAVRHIDRRSLFKEWSRRATLLRVARAQRSLDAF